MLRRNQHVVPPSGRMGSQARGKSAGGVRSPDATRSGGCRTPKGHERSFGNDHPWPQRPDQGTQQLRQRPAPAEGLTMAFAAEPGAAGQGR